VNRGILQLLRLPADAHIVSITEHNCRFGFTHHQPACLDCHYVGPFVSPTRAKAIAAEHTAKMLGTWTAAK
jgi:hypothetical protein